MSFSFFNDRKEERRKTYGDAGLCIVENHGKPVTSFERFYSVKDLQNDAKAIFIKPLACIFLRIYHSLNFFYELALAAINLCTLSFKDAWEHVKKSATSFISVFYYEVLAVGELICQLASFAVRGILTLGHGIGQLASDNKDPQEETITYQPCSGMA